MPIPAFGYPVRAQNINRQLKGYFITASMMFLFFLQTTILLAETSIDDQLSTSNTGSINRELTEKNATRLNNINGVKYELIEVNDALKDIVLNPEQIEKETVAIERAPVADKPEIVTNATTPAPSPDKVNKKAAKHEQAIKPTSITRANTPSIKKLTPIPIKAVPVEVVTATVESTTSKPAFNKHDANGRRLENETKEWACVHDTKNGLMWEVKSSNDALRNSNNLYSWFKPEDNINGIANGGRCTGDAACDTHAYVQAMNKQNFCGHDDWHLPTREEMQTLVYLKNNEDPVKINKQYFPETVPSWYWTASENNDNNNFAWYVLFRNGVSLNDLKERPKHIRLVRNYIQQ